MNPSKAGEAQREVRSLEDLIEVLASAERPSSRWAIGAESEKFGVHAETGRPLGYDGDFGVLRLFDWLVAEQGWQPVSEFEGGPVIALTRGGANITLEPGAQFELSGAPLPNVHEVVAEHDRHLEELQGLADRIGVAWLMTGFHPLARQEDLPWVPKQRYGIMREYLPKQGNGALDMMRRTATVQGNFDWSSEEDGMRKLRLALKVSPLLHAWFANAPFAEGRANGLMSLRGDVWLRMDPSRSGLVPSVLDDPRAGYRTYVEWALDAGMFLVKRGDRILRNTGQTFRQFWADGFEGERATVADFRLHLNTLFPEARLKGTLEVRSADCLPPVYAGALLALWTGLLYDAGALDAALALVEPWSAAALEESRPALVREGLRASLCGRPAVRWAEQLLEIARGGLERRNARDAEGRTEAALLAPASALVEANETPADQALRRWESAKAAGQSDVAALITSTRLRG